MNVPTAPFHLEVGLVAEEELLGRHRLEALVELLAVVVLVSQLLDRLARLHRGHQHLNLLADHLAEHVGEGAGDQVTVELQKREEEVCSTIVQVRSLYMIR